MPTIQTCGSSSAQKSITTRASLGTNRQAEQIYLFDLLTTGFFQSAYSARYFDPLPVHPSVLVGEKRSNHRPHVIRQQSRTRRRRICDGVQRFNGTAACIAALL